MILSANDAAAGGRSVSYEAGKDVIGGGDPAGGLAGSGPDILRSGAILQGGWNDRQARRAVHGSEAAGVDGRETEHEARSGQTDAVALREWRGARLPVRSEHSLRLKGGYQPEADAAGDRLLPAKPGFAVCADG